MTFFLSADGQIIAILNFFFNLTSLITNVFTLDKFIPPSGSNHPFYFYNVSTSPAEMFDNDDKLEKISDLLLIVILIIFEFDGVIYHETYDPLIYILVFLTKNCQKEARQ